jgi:myo-inositol-1(or 4)-monophosphatase
MHAIPEFQAVCEEAVHAAGDLLLERQGRVQVREKGPADLVTEADFAAQETVRRIVLSAFPDHCLLGEEGPRGTDPRAEYRWIVDPLDGTTNYVHGIPLYAVSLALERNGELLVGAIYDPVSKECFTAAAGHGAFLNGRPIRTSRIKELKGAVGAAGLPAIVHRDSPDLLVFLELLPECQALRRLGSAALNMAYLAAGRIDLFWSFSTKIWDIAAGALLIHEAGGVTSSPEGGEFLLEKAHFLTAANADLHRQLVAVVRRALGRPQTEAQ